MALTNSQYDTIQKMYDDVQRENRFEMDERAKYVNEHIDGYKELSDAIASLSVESAKAMLDGKSVVVEDLKATIKDLRSQKEALLVAAGLPKDYLAPIYNCPDCKDTGYIDGNKCHCFKQTAVSLLYKQSNISDFVKSVDFSDFDESYYKGDDLEYFHDTLKKSQDFVKNFNLHFQNLIFYGTVGSGKSMMSACIAKELMQNGHSCIYFSASGLMDELSKYTFDYKSKSDNTIHSDISECDLLIIDDLGTEMTNNFSISALFSCLNERALSKKSTIISTNLTLEDLRDRYSDRIFSRIAGGFTFCRLTGPDIRFASKRNNN